VLVDALTALHEALIAPLALPSDTQLLAVSPDETLAGVPWGALLRPGGLFRRLLRRLGHVVLHPLYERLAVTVVPSARLLLASVTSGSRANQANDVPRVALIGALAAISSEQQMVAMPLLERQRRTAVSLASLQHGFDELVTVRTAMRAGHVAALLDTETLSGQTHFSEANLARADAVLAAMSGASFVHVVAHALFNAELPMESVILLDPKAEHGWITAADMLTVNFGAARLVVLSACGTAQGRVAVGAEVFGFLRALMAGGAKAMVLTRWPVDDAATAKFFRVFYEALQRDSTAEALRRAATTTARINAHPFFWAGPTLYGWWRREGIYSPP